MTTLAGQDWFANPTLQNVLAVLNGDGAVSRLVGGAVRNALMGLPVSDFDIATTLTPDEVIARAKSAGFRWVPTGIAHGTVTLVSDGIPFEVTTLRRDVATDGRRARVAYTDDWQADASRRDFTINALYAGPDGVVHDHVGGLDDIRTRTLRFIGVASERIAEDYLRILRFFRFFAHYGGGRPDPEGLKACAAARSQLRQLSAERVWSELKKLLSARDCSRALLWMRTTGVLTEVLPETDKWGIDAIPALMDAEQAFGWHIDPILRLAAIVPPDADRLDALSERLRLSRTERDLLVGFARLPALGEDVDMAGLARILYRHKPTAMILRLKLMLAASRAKEGQSIEGLARIARLSSFLKIAQDWRQPACPVSGKDLLDAGFKPGPEIGETLRRLESIWVERNFQPDRQSLLTLAGQPGPA